MEGKQTTPPEIDLVSIFQPIGVLLTKLIVAFKYAMRFLLANIGLLLIIIIIVTSIGYALRFVITPTYVVSGFFMGRGIPGPYFSNQLESLNSNPGTLATLLQVPQEAAASVKAIHSEPMATPQNSQPKDSSLREAIFSVNLSLYNTQYIDTLQKGLIRYLENNPYLEARKKARLRTFELLKSSLDKKIQSLDSLKVTIDNKLIPRGQGQGIILAEPINPVSVYQAEMAYYKEKLKLDEDIQLLSNNVEVLQPFFVPGGPSNPNFNGLLIKFFIGSVILALLVVIVYGKRPAK